MGDNCPLPINEKLTNPGSDFAIAKEPASIAAATTNSTVAVPAVPGLSSSTAMR
jgi:hypothetical protein